MCNSNTHGTSRSALAIALKLQPEIYTHFHAYSHTRDKCNQFFNLCACVCVELRSMKSAIIDRQCAPRILIIYDIHSKTISINNFESISVGFRIDIFVFSLRTSNRTNTFHFVSINSKFLRFIIVIAILVLYMRTDWCARFAVWIGCNEAYWLCSRFLQFIQSIAFETQLKIQKMKSIDSKWRARFWNPQFPHLFVLFY